MTSASAIERRDTDFEQILAAVMETARGRWFLAEFARRNRSADTASVLAAVARLEGKLRRPPPAAENAPDEQRLVIRQVTEALLLLREGEHALAAALGDAWAETAMIASRNAETRLEGALLNLGAEVPPRPERELEASPVEVAAMPVEQPGGRRDVVLEAAPIPQTAQALPPPSAAATAEPMQRPVLTPAPMAAPDLASPQVEASEPSSRPTAAPVARVAETEPDTDFADRLAAELAAIPVPRRVEPAPEPMTIAAEAALPRPAAIALEPAQPSPPQQEAAAPAPLPPAPSAPRPALAAPPVTAPEQPKPPEPARPSLFRPSTLVTLRQRTTPAKEVALENDPTALMTKAEKIALFS